MKKLFSFIKDIWSNIGGEIWKSLLKDSGIKEISILAGLTSLAFNLIFLLPAILAPQQCHEPILYELHWSFTFLIGLIGLFIGVFVAIFLFGIGLIVCTFLVCIILIILSPIYFYLIKPFVDKYNLKQKAKRESLDYILNDTINIWDEFWSTKVMQKAGDIAFYVLVISLFLFVIAILAVLGIFIYETFMCVNY